MAQVVKIRHKSMRPQTVGSACHLELEHAQLDADLQDLAPSRAGPRAQVLAGLGIIGPSLDHVIQVPSHHGLPIRRSNEDTTPACLTRQSKNPILPLFPIPIVRRIRLRTHCFKLYHFFQGETYAPTQGLRGA